jgi:hypothetical protein
MEIDDKLDHEDINAFLATIPASDPRRRGNQGKRWKQPIEQRARSYARGVLMHDDGSGSSISWQLECAWQRGYEAAIRDVRKIYSMKGGGRATAMHELLKPKRGR